MTRDKDRKRIIRRRMDKTGESYTAARAHILSKVKIAPPPPAVDLAALAGMRDDAIEPKTGRTWRQWTEVLDAENAVSMRHRDVAALLSTKYGVPGWWSQMLTVGYERIKGLREQGQRLDKTYEAGKSRTLGVPVRTLFKAFADAKTRRRWLDDPKITVRTASAPKRLRLQWPDGTIVIAEFTAKGAAKSAVAVVHTKLRDRGAADNAKRYWGEKLDALKELLPRSSPR